MMNFERRPYGEPGRDDTFDKQAAAVMFFTVIGMLVIEVIQLILLVKALG